MWLTAAESGLDVREAVNWQKQGHRFSPLPRLQWSSFTVGCPELPKDRKTVLRSSWSSSLQVSNANNNTRLEALRLGHITYQNGEQISNVDRMRQ